MSESSYDEDTEESIRILNGDPIGTIVPRRSTREIHTPVRFRNYALMNNVMNTIEPLNYEHAKYKEE